MWRQTQAEGAQSTCQSSWGRDRVSIATELGIADVSDNNQDITHEIAAGGHQNCACSVLAKDLILLPLLTFQYQFLKSASILSMVSETEACNPYMYSFKFLH